ncbi:MAG: universal stress protein [Burkholderiales bacterium]
MMLKILLPTDGSDYALRAVRYLTEHVGWYREPLEVHLLNVQLPIASGAVKMFISQQQLNDYYREEGLKHLQQARSLLETSGVVYQHHIGVGELASTIVEYATDKGCEMILMGTRGRGALKGAMLGSVAMKVLHRAEVPVLLVR